jgi:hypothetical protein
MIWNFNIYDPHCNLIRVNFDYTGSILHWAVRFELKPIIWTVAAAIHIDKNIIEAVEVGSLIPVNLECIRSTFFKYREHLKLIQRYRKIKIN